MKKATNVLTHILYWIIVVAPAVLEVIKKLSVGPVS